MTSPRKRVPLHSGQQLLPFTSAVPQAYLFPYQLLDELKAFSAEGKETQVSQLGVQVGGNFVQVPVFTNEFWTSQQRQGHSLHEISYRACFKPQLPRFYIERLTAPGARVNDPFLGRGTTVLEAALLDRRVCGCDVNPLSIVLLAPRLRPPSPEEVRARLREIPFSRPVELRKDLLVFFHKETLQEICALRAYLLTRAPLDPVDAWIQMVATNRLTGHSEGFFSVYTLPPNQATSIERQHRINADRGQVPPRRVVPELIIRKSDGLMKKLSPTERKVLAACDSHLLTCHADAETALPAASVDLTVTSPPFLDVVQYHVDNWLRCWFIGIDPAAVDISVTKDVMEWRKIITRSQAEAFRATRSGGWMAFEVGEVRNGSIHLEEHVLPCGIAAGWDPVCVMINDQKFTKTSNIWGQENNSKGTNTNRIVIFHKRA